MLPHAAHPLSPLWLALHLPETVFAGPEALQSVACWAARYTPRVSLAPPAGLLLEVGGCLRLWGGLEQLIQRVSADLRAQQWAPGLAVAPTPQGALWLAQAQPGIICSDLDALRQSLGRLSPDAIDLPETTRVALRGFGLHTLGEIRQMPRAGLTQRIGSAAMRAMDRAWGELPDPRGDFRFPERFALALELPAAVATAAALLFAARRLTAALAGWLTLRQAGLAEGVLDLTHSSRETSHLVLRFAEPTRDLQRFDRVLRERLERLILAAPVVALRLRVDSVEPLADKNGVLFGGGEMARSAMAALIERLRARLGEAAVFAITPHADFRPECATQKVGAGSTALPGVAPLVAPRPFWLLEAPEALAEIHGQPCRGGPLRLVCGPERIESGWWDADEAACFGDVRRDYFVALTADGRRAWLFRERRAPGGWFLHGWFA